MNATDMVDPACDAGNVCRCCATRQELTYDIFVERCSNGRTYCDVLMECVAVQISKDDRLPAFVCYTCSSFLEYYVVFRKKCIESTATLLATEQHAIKDEPVDAEEHEFVDVKEEFVDDDDAGSFSATDDPVPDETYGSAKTDLRTTEPEPNAAAADDVDGRRRHRCDVCGKSYVQKKYLKVHRMVHTGEKPFKCDECGKSFRAKQNLLWHGYIHTGDVRPHKCDLCDKSFLQRTKLDAHRNVHTGEKPYACDACGRSYKTKPRLTMHSGKCKAKHDPSTKPDRKDFEVSDERVAVPPDPDDERRPSTEIKQEPTE